MSDIDQIIDGNLGAVTGSPFGELPISLRRSLAAMKRKRESETVERFRKTGYRMSVAGGMLIFVKP